MKLTQYFTRHPVAAIVLNCMIVLIGIMCLKSLPIREYPKVDTPVITIVANYPNASPDLIETSVTNILEDNLAGVEGVDSIKSWSSHGSCEIRLDFIPGTSIDRSVALIRDAISLARSHLPADVKEPTIIRSGKANGGVAFMFVSLEADNMSAAELTHYANINVKNVIRSVNGVSSIEVWGPQYTYDVKLDSRKLHMFGINVDEAFNAIASSNKSMPVGKFMRLTPTTLETELKTKSDFEKIVLRNKDYSNPKNRQHAVFLKDVATIKLKESDEFRVHVNGKAAGLSLAINKSTDANPLDVSSGVRKEVEALKKILPSNIKINVVTDQAEFVRASLNNIYSATVEAILLVLAIVFLFLRNIRATIVPLVTIPISLIGSILFLKMLGFSINTMTLLAMVLAVGLVVDDAIVVLENISRHKENGKTAFKAAIDGANEIGFAIVAVTLTLVSVYAPFAFIEGAVGKIFIEFAVALAGSVLLSGIAALTLSPLMCSIALKKESKNILPKVDDFLNNITKKYGTLLNKAIVSKKFAGIVIVAACLVTTLFFTVLPSEVAPKEDRGLIGLFIPPSPGKDIVYYDTQLKKVEKIVGVVDEAKNNLGFAGTWGATVVLPLKEKSKRKRSSSDIVNSLFPKTMMMPSQDVWPWSWDTNLPGVADEISFAGVEIVVSTTDSYKKLYDNMEKVVKALDADKTFYKPRHDLNINALSYKIDINNDLASKLSVNNHQIAKTIEVFFSDNTYLNFQKDGILYNITISGDKKPWSLSELYITNPYGKKIPISNVAKMTSSSEPSKLFHYNQMKAATIGVDLGTNEKLSTVYQKLTKVLNDTLPQSYKIAPIGSAKALNASSNTMMLLFALAIIFIFAILSVQFNNFIDPLLVILTIPLACSGALLTIWFFGVSLNVYTQVGLITLIGLITKHGILIVEFVNKLLETGESSILEAVHHATITRFRPIIMTTGAMVFGSLPLILSHDSGYEARSCIGYIIVGGLIFGTIFTLFVLPSMCYYTKTMMKKFIKHEV